MRSAADGSPSFVHLPALSVSKAGAEIAIEGEEAHYLRRVVRIRPGETVTATDGRGALAELHVLEVGPGMRAEVRALRRVERAAEVTVWCGAPEGDRADWLVEKLAEMGVAALQPVDAERGRWERAESRAERWRRLAIAALRQSRSAHLLEILPARPLAKLLEAGRPAGEAWLADPSGARFEPSGLAKSLRATAAVGPSSGFSPDELKRLEECGFAAVRLTAARLRTETAALALSALVLASCPQPDLFAPAPHPPAVP
jgi:16S rRNA (uracil1498-N3)-methyltransferase